MEQLELTQDFEGNPVRMLGTVEEPLFVAADVCRVLGIKNVADALGRLDGDEVASADVTDAIGRIQETRTITEAGFYRLVNGARVRGSKAELIKRFQRWVAHDVLVPLRKHGVVADTKGVLHPSPIQLVEPGTEAALSFVERCYALLERIGMADDRSRFMAADIVHNAMSRALPGRASTEPEATVQAAQPKTVAQICLEQGATERDVCLSQVGRLAAKRYEEKHGSPPTLKITQAIGGRPTPVTVYAEEDWPLVIDSLRQRREIEAKNGGQQ